MPMMAITTSSSTRVKPRLRAAGKAVDRTRAAIGVSIRNRNGMDFRTRLPPQGRQFRSELAGEWAGYPNRGVELIGSAEPSRTSDGCRSDRCRGPGSKRQKAEAPPYHY